MVGRTRVQSDPLIRSSFPPLGLCKDGEVGRSMELDGRYNSTHTRVYIYIYIYISGGGWTHFGLTLRAETLPLGKLSSENAHPRYGKCKHFCGSSAQWAERRF